MELTKDGKTLYHIQSIPYYTDEPIDYFVLLGRFPSGDDVMKLIRDGFEDKNDPLIKEIFDSHNVYTVYTTEL